MPRALLQQSAWNAGEFSPRLHGRSDFPKYQAGSKRLENLLLHPTGGFQKRSGTRYIGDAYSASHKSILVPFKFSTDDSYVLELSHNGDIGTIRFYRDGGIVTVTSRTFTNANVNTGADTITISAHFFDTGQGPFWLTNGGGGLPAPLAVSTDYYVIRVDANTIKLATSYANAVAGTAINLTTTGGAGPHTVAAKTGTTVPAQVNHTFTETELFEFQWAESADVLYLVHSSHEPQTLTRISHSEWILGDFTFLDGPWLSLNQTSTTMNCGAISAGASGTVTASTATFTANDVGRQIRIQSNNNGGASANWGWGTITAFTSSTQVTVLAGRSIAAPATPTVSWRLGAFYAGNYPSCVAIAEQRLCFGGEPNTPETIHLSCAGDYNRFAPVGNVSSDAGSSNNKANDQADGSVNANNAIDATFGSSEVQAIRFLAGSKNLVAGTTGGIWPVRGSSTDEALTPTNAQTRRSSAFGASLRMPVQIDDLVVHISRERRRIRALGYTYDSDAYKSVDMNRLADHVGLASQFVQMAYQQEPTTSLWVVREDGVVASCVFQPGEDVLGWSRHTLGGAYSSGASVVESVCVIPSAAGDEDEVWFVVKRTINGATARTVERLEPRFEDGDALEDAWFVDAAASTGGTSYAITGLSLASTAVVTVASTAGLSNGDRIRITGVSGVSTTDDYGQETSLVNGRYFLVANVTATTFELQDLSSVNYSTASGSAYVSGGSAQKTITTVSGLTWLEGQTVTVNADGSLQTATVSAGAITLGTPTAKAVVGLPYAASWESLPMQVDDGSGSGQGRLARPAMATLRLLRTVGALAIGRSDAALEDVPEVASSTTPTTAASTLFSGDLRVTVPGGWERGQGLILSHDEPFPWEQVSVVVHGEAGYA